MGAEGGRSLLLNTAIMEVVESAAGPGSSDLLTESLTLGKTFNEVWGPVC